MDEKIEKLFLPLLDRLYNTEPAGEPFRKPVDVVKYGCFDYYYYVRHPIDLSTIRDKLTEHRYSGDAWRFVADIQLMFSNAYLFNKKGTPVYDFTNKLNKIWIAELTPIMQRLNYCCGTLHKFGPQLLFCHGTTADKYCQIAIGAKYKCYQDQYSYCLPCFNRIDSDTVLIQDLSCETARMQLPPQPVKKSDFIDCANDNWQYESFIQCTQCSRRVHQICELHPADEDIIDKCIQHAQVEHEQKMLCQVPEEYRTDTAEADKTAGENKAHKTKANAQYDQLDQESREASEGADCDANQTKAFELSSLQSAAALDDELLQFARDLDDSHDLTLSAPTSPGLDDLKSHKFDCAKTTDKKNSTPRASNIGSTATAKTSVDRIAARLSINKMTSNDGDTAHESKKINRVRKNRDKFVCNHCYREKKVGFNLRHRKFSARRLPHTRMSRYIETKVNEYIRVNSPTAGEVTIRVLTAYRDITKVKSEMREYVHMSRGQAASQQHPNLKDYPDEFGFTNRAIFAWQEIEGVDVCVFGMHVQEYGEDCPEPNRQVVYLSYLDSVHFFRPKPLRTAVYHEILLSYFKYVKKLGFRRVFIWVCPSRKGDDYIFYRHPTEQRMPTLKRLSDWYINLLDKGIMAGIVERHQNIYQYAESQHWTSLLSMPYLSGDYWPGEFERLLKIMIESKKEYDLKMEKLIQERNDLNTESSTNHDGFNKIDSDIMQKTEKHNMLSLSSLYSRPPMQSAVAATAAAAVSLITKLPQLLGSNMNSRLNESNLSKSDFCMSPDGDSSMVNDMSGFDFALDTSRSSSDQPLDLSKSSSTTSPESYIHNDFEDDIFSDLNYKTTDCRKKRRKSNQNTIGYTKKRGRVTQSQKVNRQNTQATNATGYNSHGSQTANLSQKSAAKQKSSTQSNKDSHNSDSLMSPEEEMIMNLNRSLKRQREGFIVARLNECDCSPHFESQRRREEAFFTCELMRGREPFLQLARLKNYEFSTLRRAKFSSLAMVKHLGKYFKLDPICNECYSFDSSKRHYACSHCEDFYLCTSCHENTQHAHIMSLMAPISLPDIDEFMQQCSLTSAAISISSASSTISNKSFGDNPLDTSSSTDHQISVDESVSAPALWKDNQSGPAIVPLNRHLLNSSMPLGQRQKKRTEYKTEAASMVRHGDEENADISFATSAAAAAAAATTKQLDSVTSGIMVASPTPPPSHSSSQVQLELDQVIMDNFIRQAEVSYNVDFDQMKAESKKLLTHYPSCPIKDTCNKCKFVILSCSFMGVLMRNARVPMIPSRTPGELMASGNASSNAAEVNQTAAHQRGSRHQNK